MDRLDRQKRIPGWKQEMLANAHIVVLGAGQLANCIGGGCSGLGIGNVTFIGDGIVSGQGIERASEGFLFFEAEKGDSKVKTIAKLVRKISLGDTKAIGIDAPLDKSALSYVKRPDVIIDSTNSQTSKYFAHEYCTRNNVLFISASTSETKCSIRIFNKFSGKSLEDKLAHKLSISDTDLMPEVYESLPQGNAMSGLTAGVVLGELRHILMPLSGDGKPVRSIDYDCLSDERTQLTGPNQSSHNRFDDKTILLIGAGAIGNYAALWASLTGARLIIADGDTVDHTNLNRQVLYYGSVDRPKASSLAAMLGKITKRKIGYSIGYVDDRCIDLIERTSPDLIIAGVDRDEVRLRINNLVIKSGMDIPLIDTASSKSGGEAYFSVPGKTTCIRHQKWGFGTDSMLYEKVKEDRRLIAERKAKNQGHGCAYEADSSVIMSNLAAGSLAIAEGAHILAQSGRFVKGCVVYAPWQVYRLEYNELNFSRARECHSHNCVLPLDNL